MKTANVLDKLPKHARERIENYRFEYTHTDSVKLQAEIRSSMAGYVLGLRDSGLITEVERQILFVYTTI